MSEHDNVELVQRAFEVWNRGSIEEFLELVDPEVEWCPNQQMPDVDAVYRGHEGVRRFFRDFIEPWETITVEALDTRTKGDEVVMLVRFQAKGRDGIEVDVTRTHRYTGREGRLIAFRSYDDHALALAEAGID